MTLHLYHSAPHEPVMRDATTRCPTCRQLVAMCEDRGVLRLAAHDYPAVEGLAGACPSSGLGLGRLQARVEMCNELERTER